MTSLIEAEKFNKILKRIYHCISRMIKHDQNSSMQEYKGNEILGKLVI